MNGSPASFDGNKGTFAAPLTLPAPGPFTITVRATDGAGNVSNPVTSTFTLDQTAPSITIDSPANNAALNGPSVTVTGTVSDVGSAVASVTVNGVSAIVNGNTYSANVNIPCSRPISLVAIATDLGGNTMVARRDVTVTVNSPTSPCWQGAGPEGAIINVIAVDPSNSNNIYIGANRGLFKSIDRGTTWSRSNAGLSDLSAVSIAIDPKNPSIVYVGTFESNVYKSTDGGATWNKVATGLTTVQRIVQVVVDPVNSNNIYVASVDQGIIKSTDGGVNWSSLNLSSTPVSLQALTIDPGNPNTLYAGLSNGLLKSTDGGVSWNSAAAGLTSPSVVQILVSPASSSALYILTQSGISRSTNAGANWTPANTGLPSTVVNAIAIDTKNPSTLYAGSSFGLVRSTDGGNSWNNTNLINIPSSAVLSIAVDPSDSNAIYTGTFIGFLKTINGGSIWSQSNAGIDALLIVSLSADPIASGTVFAGPTNGLYKTTDGGITWKLTSFPLNTEARQVAVSPFDHSIVFAAAFNALYRSTDGGNNWSSVGPGGFSVAIDPYNRNVIYAGSSGSIAKSSDGGTTWVPLNNPVSSVQVFTIIIDRTNTNKIYLATNRGVYKTSDGGATWTQILNPFLLSNSVFNPGLTLDPAHPGTIYEAVSNSGVYKSSDDGSTWTPLTHGLPQLLLVNGITVDTGNTNNVYLSTLQGLFKSSDAGNNWTLLNGTQDSLLTETMVVDPINTNTVYLASTGVERLDQPSGPLAAPALTHLNQSTGTVGDNGLTLQVSGVNFGNSSVVQWNGSPRATTLINSTLLSASISASDFSSAGTNTLTVSTPGAGTSNSLPFTVGKGTASLQLANLNQVYDGNPKSINVTTDPAGLDGISITYNGSSSVPTDAGTYTVVASLTNQNYQASNVSGTLVIAKADQAITFSPIPDKLATDSPFRVNAAASSGLAVVLDATGNISVSGNTVTILGTGTATITASQSGDNNHNAAAPVTQTFQINNPLPQVFRLNPGAIIAGSTSVTLRIFGGNFVAGSTVEINNVLHASTFVNSTEIDVPLTSGETATEATDSVTVVNSQPGGGSAGATLKIISVTSTDTKNIQPGSSDTASNAPSQAGQAGITAQLSHSPSSGGAATVTVSTYSADPLGNSGLIDVGGGYVDLNVTGASPSDSLNATFYYSSDVTGVNETKLRLLYFTGSQWAAVKGSGGVDPAKNTTDNQDGTVSGGTFTVVFDETSSPKLSELTGTIFSSSPGLFGDLNGDLQISASDLVLMANGIAGNIPINSQASDLNGDGAVTISDLVILANFIAGNIGHLPVSNGP